MALEKAFQEAGFGEGVYQYAPISASQLETVIASDKVKGGSLTGSDKAGKTMAKLCGENLKKWVLELGGSDPFIVLDDADLDKAAELAVAARFMNNAQACINAKRFIINENIYNEFKEKVINQVEKLKIGDPSDESTDLGPLSKESGLKTLKEQVKDTLNKGGKIGYGDQEQLDQEIDISKGLFFKPLILENIPKDSPAYKEELFGPVMIFFKVKDEDEAIKLANDNQFGLGGSVHTKDVKRGEKVALQIETGMVYVNDFPQDYSELPFGGVKNSGFGREGSYEGCKQFVNIKTIALND